MASSSERAAADLGVVGGSRRPAWVSIPLGLGLRTVNNLNKRAARAMLARMAARSRHDLRFENVGRGEGAWSTPTALLKPDGVAYCVGVGTNASFDEALATQYRMRVFSIDPTPIAVKHMASLNRDEARHRFLPVGMWNADTVLRLYAPMSASANLSAHDIHATGRYIEMPVKTLRTIMREQGHDRIDLLKIDIEGSWLEVIEDVCRTDVPVSILCAEFDSPTSPWKALRAIKALRARGFDLVHADRENLIFVQRDLMASAAA